MRNPVTTVKRKFDGSAKPPWDGDLVCSLMMTLKPPHMTTTASATFTMAREKS